MTRMQRILRHEDKIVSILSLDFIVMNDDRLEQNIDMNIARHLFFFQVKHEINCQ
jgi:hypothetical protein